MIGAEAKDAFFSETDRSLNMNEAYDSLAAIFGEVAFLAEHETYLNHRPILHALFGRERMAGYHKVMVAVVREWLDGLDQEGEMEITHETGELVKEVAGRCFLGKEINQQLEEEFWKAYADLSRAMDPVLPPDWPLLKFFRCDQAKKCVRDVLAPLVRERRANPVDDPFPVFVEVRTKDGELPEEETIVKLLMALLFAGHETTAGQTAWNVIQLIQSPEYLKLEREEVDSELGECQPFEQSMLRKLSHVKMAVDETARMRPSVETIMRTAKQDFVVPKGWMVQTATAVDHFRADVFRDPYQYEPLSFSKERREDWGEKHALIGFGGGLQKCVGMNFAKNEMTIIATLLFKEYDLELISGKPEIKRGLGSSRPSKTKLRYWKRGTG